MDIRNVIVVILAYGLWGTNKRTPKEIVGYGMYLNECANALRHLAQCGYDVRVILCGGAEQDGETEAESMAKYFEPLTRECELSLYYESHSLTTPANIWQAGATMVDCHWQGRIIVFCDTAREAKVRWLLKKYCQHLLYELRVIAKRLHSNISSNVVKTKIEPWRQAEVIAFGRPDITIKSTKLFQLCEVLAMMFIPGYLRKRIYELRAE